MFYAKDMNSGEEAVEQIKLYHKKETCHSGVDENYRGLKNKIYYTNLRELINSVINACNICKMAKYDRQPIKPKYQVTETPKDVNEIIHTDIFFIGGAKFMISVDKFFKLATSTYLPNVSYDTLEETVLSKISTKGKIKKIVSDNEFNIPRIIELYEKLGIEYHFTKISSHTGNAGIEVLHRTI